MTLEKLAEKANLSTNYVGSVEIGRRDPSLSTIQALAKALGTTAGELLGGVRGLGSESLEIATLAERATPEQRTALAALLRTIARRK